ncbi:MAG: CARDB domain-containing protein [Candidatus Sumerlaeaceae bacterium]
MKNVFRRITLFAAVILCPTLTLAAEINVNIGTVVNFPTAGYSTALSGVVGGSVTLVNKETDDKTVKLQLGAGLSLDNSNSNLDANAIVVGPKVESLDGSAVVELKFTYTLPANAVPVASLTLTRTIKLLDPNNNDQELDQKNIDISVTFPSLVVNGDDSSPFQFKLPVLAPGQTSDWKELTFTNPNATALNLKGLSFIDNLNAEVAGLETDDLRGLPSLGNPVTVTNSTPFSVRVKVKLKTDSDWRLEGTVQSDSLQFLSAINPTGSALIELSGDRLVKSLTVNPTEIGLSAAYGVTDTENFTIRNNSNVAVSVLSVAFVDLSGTPLPTTKLSIEYISGSNGTIGTAGPFPANGAVELPKKSGGTTAEATFKVSYTAPKPSITQYLGRIDLGVDYGSLDTDIFSIPLSVNKEIKKAEPSVDVPVPVPPAPVPPTMTFGSICKGDESPYQIFFIRNAPAPADSVRQSFQFRMKLQSTDAFDDPDIVIPGGPSSTENYDLYDYVIGTVVSIAPGDFYAVGVRYTPKVFSDAPCYVRIESINNIVPDTSNPGQFGKFVAHVKLQGAISMADTCPVPDGADLIPIFTQFTKGCYRSKCTWSGTIGVRNQGPVTAPQSRMAFYLVTDGQERMLRSIRIPELKPGVTYTYSPRLHSKRDLTGSVLRAVVDSKLEVNETDNYGRTVSEDNNIATSSPLP